MRRTTMRTLALSILGLLGLIVTAPSGAAAAPASAGPSAVPAAVALTLTDAAGRTAHAATHATLERVTGEDRLSCPPATTPYRSTVVTDGARTVLVVCAPDAPGGGPVEVGLSYVPGSGPGAGTTSRHWVREPAAGVTVTYDAAGRPSAVTFAGLALALPHRPEVASFRGGRPDLAATLDGRAALR